MSRQKSIELEYTHLKEEQLARIGYRDNMVYLALVAFGTVWTFALTNANHLSALLVLPFVSVILGWMYVVNDQKISAIGKYICLNLTTHTSNEETTTSNLDFGWEVEHRDDSSRLQRKVIQCVVDLLTFVVSGSSAIVAYAVLVWPLSTVIIIILIGEIIILGVLAWQMLQYADISKGKPSGSQ